MVQQHKKQAASTAAASSATSSGSSSSSRSIHGSMSSAFLGVSSSTHSQSSQLRRSSPSLYPPPAAALPGHLASRGSAAAASGGGSSASGSSSSQFHRISHSRGVVAKRRSRPNNRVTHSLPTPFLTELISIRRMGTKIFGELNALEIITQRKQQALAMRGLSAGFTPPPLQQQQPQPLFSSLHPLPSGNFCGFPLPASQPQNMQPSSSFSSTDLPSSIFSGSEQPAASQHFSSLPSKETQLPPLPPSLEIQQDALPPPPPLGQLSQNTSSTGLVQPSPSSEFFGQVSTSLPTNLEDRIQLGGSSSALSMRGTANGGAQIWEAMPTPASVHDKVNNGGGSSRTSIPMNCDSSIPMYSESEEKALQQLRVLLSRWPSSASSRCNQSMGSSVEGSCQSWADMLALANKMDMMSIGSSSCSAGPKMPSNYSSLSMENSNSVPAVPKLILGGMDRPGLPPRSPVPGARASRSTSRRGWTKQQYFSEAEMEKINEDNGLKELLETDSKKVMRILRNRKHVARRKAQKASHFRDLQRRADALRMHCRSLSAQVQSRQEMLNNLKIENREAQIKLKGLKELDNLKQVLNHQMQSELERLKS